MKRWITGLKIWLWWNFVLRRDEFHPRLNYVKFKSQKECYLKREIAHLLDSGVSPFNPLIISLWERAKHA